MPEFLELLESDPGAVHAQLYDLVLQAVGRVPNGKKIAADIHANVVPYSLRNWFIRPM